MSKAVEYVLSQVHSQDSCAWIEFWSAFADRQGVSCFCGQELSTWAWWKKEIGTTCQDKRPEALLRSVEDNMECPGSEYPRYDLEWNQLQTDPRWDTEDEGICDEFYELILRAPDIEVTL